jgi:aryl-alcohol dehydrogenase-like predicted oxidoreductase
VDESRLGLQGPIVSRLGLGTAQFGTLVDRQHAARLLDRFLAAGGTLVDTADIYGRESSGSGQRGPGASESLLGDVLRGRRSRVFLASKVGQASRLDPGYDEVGLSPSRIRAAVDASLRRLNTDWIDLYQCHLWDPYMPVEDTLGALSDLVTDGKIRFIGVSNWDGWQVVDAAWKASRLSRPAIVSNQLWYNLVDRRIENSVIPACRQVGVAIVAYGAIAQGFLAGGYRRSSRGDRDPGGRFSPEGLLPDRSWAGLATTRGWSIVEAVAGVADELGLSPSVVALRWLLDSGGADVVLLGSRDDDQLADLLAVTDAVLPPEARDRLTEVSEPDATYPRSFTETYSRRESPYFGGMVAPVQPGSAGAPVSSANEAQ